MYCEIIVVIPIPIHLTDVFNPFTKPRLKDQTFLIALNESLLCMCVVRSYYAGMSMLEQEAHLLCIRHKDLK